MYRSASLHIVANDDTGGGRDQRQDVPGMCRGVRIPGSTLSRRFLEHGRYLGNSGHARPHYTPPTLSSMISYILTDQTHATISLSAHNSGESITQTSYDALIFLCSHRGTSSVSCDRVCAGRGSIAARRPAAKIAGTDVT